MLKLVDVTKARFDDDAHTVHQPHQSTNVEVVVNKHAAQTTTSEQKPISVLLLILNES